jgi:hypothetical protein
MLCIECNVIRRVKGEGLDPEFLAEMSDPDLSHKEDPFVSGYLTLLMYFLCRDRRGCEAGGDWA